jgi:exodeoxyribonuclease III
VRIATWNVNSVGARLPRLNEWLEIAAPDVLCLQETKCAGDAFPGDGAEALGYEVAVNGEGRWNGVAILSRVGLSDVTASFEAAPAWGDPPVVEARALSAVCGGVHVTSVYVPNGRHLEDPHMVYKLEWLAKLQGQARQWVANGEAAAVMGDWNIAPQDEDVWSMEYYLDKSHVSPGERAGFQGILDAGYVDVVRPHTPGPGVYTYWDYTRLAFQKRRGMRIDFILGSPAFADRVVGAAIDREERKGKGASDHAPVVVQLDD